MNSVQRASFEFNMSIVNPTIRYDTNTMLRNTSVEDTNMDYRNMYGKTAHLRAMQRETHPNNTPLNDCRSCQSYMMYSTGF